jgi:hypothetical protein
MVEVPSPFPRSDLIPSLPPFARAQCHLRDLVPQVQQLLQEDLADLRQPLGLCLEEANAEEELAATQHAIAVLEQLIQQIPLQLQPLLDCFHHQRVQEAL